MLTHGGTSLQSDNEPPEYFWRIKERAARRWDQLEADPELAGPWHQLFKQVQSPRHILSELLQNADDAGASEAKVSIKNERFVFEHNGEDFIEAHFASICGFGYSNKRALHTIGFRGIGFKSTFSLGDRVELFTPSLAIAFHRARFTEPLWIDGGEKDAKNTRIEVAISDASRRQEVEKNLDEWLKSPVSLLFFKSIRRLQIGDQIVHWQSLGPGPIIESEWMALDEKADEPFLLIRSKEESFPDEALDEIRSERMIGDEDGGDFPPCRVEIVLGAKGRLYVVLPTGVETPLPFACNAPFIQDPARMKIKDPETSPTNRWLLARAGQLAATAMMQWLEQTGNSSLDRADAYSLLPDVDREAGTLEGVSAATVELAFARIIEDRSILLTDDGRLVAANEAIIAPFAIFEIWPAEQAISLLDDKSRPPLSRHVSASNRKKLLNWAVVREFSKKDLLERLRANHLPRPSTWRHLLNLWSYIAPDVTNFQFSGALGLRIAPARGKDVLYSASEVVRLGEKKILQSDEDWEFLSQHLIVLNQNWTRFLAEQRRENEEPADSQDEAVEAAFAVLKKIRLEESSDVSVVLARVAADYFGSEQPKLIECVQLAQIAAKLDARAGASFRFATADRKLRVITDPILFDADGTLEELLPEAGQLTQLLHPDYSAAFKSCSREEWLRWISSGSSGVQTFLPLAQKRLRIYGHEATVAAARERGLRGSLNHPYVTSSFVIEDWDFPADAWKHWEALAESDPQIWSRVARKILEQRDSFWSRAAKARVFQIATTGNEQSLTSEALLPTWVLKLRNKPCLPDTRDFLHLPTDLLRRTPETESLMDVEPFIHGLLDREPTRPLLDLLGVRKSPSGPERLLDRLRALSKSAKSPPHEVEKWYRRLDQMYDGCSTADAQTISEAFRTERLILAQDGTWAKSDGAFLSEEDDVPGAAVIRAAVRDLSLWRRIKVADRPSADLALKWLGNLETDKVLEQDDARRVRSLLARYPTRVWEECEHWVNLLGEWVSVETLSYAFSMQSLFRWSHLHDWVKRKTADLRLPAEILTSPPFSELPALSDLVEEKFIQPTLLSSEKEAPLWLSSFGRQLGRIELPNSAEEGRVRNIAQLIADTRWIEALKLEVVPYLEGVPAGTTRLADVLWFEGKLFVSPMPNAKLARRVPEEIGKALSAELRAALIFAWERAPEIIKEYLEENFTLGAERDAPAIPKDTSFAGAIDFETDTPSIESPSDTSAANTESDENGLDLTGLELDQDGDAPDAPETNAEDQQSLEELEGPQPLIKPRAAPKPARPSLMKRFALANGFKSDGDDRFFHTDGSWIGRANGGRFPWARRLASGEVVRFYYPKDHCLEHGPLEIEADIWSLLDQKPDLYAYILSDIESRPVEVTGSLFRVLRDEGRLSLHPATYRLVYEETSHGR